MVGVPADYAFRTVWRVAGTVAEVRDVLEDGLALPRWWPAVYLAVEPVRGDGLALFTTGWLPYTLRWTLRLTEPVSDTGFALTATGDLTGTGRWTFTPDGPEVEITYDWRVSADKALLRRLTWLLRPLFTANHHWAMARGEESLRLELRRRRATTDEQRRRIPPPPPPTFRRSAGTRRGAPAAGPPA